MTKKKTHEEFKSELDDKFNSEFILLSTYNGINSRIKVKHKICGYEFEPVAKYLLRSGKCKRCSDIKKGKNKRKTHEQFLKEVQDIHGNKYQVLTEYKTMNDKVKVKHLSCGSEYYIRPDSLLSGTQCKSCLNNKLSKDNLKTTEEYKKEIEYVTQGEYTLIGEYTGVKNKVEIRHNTCGNEYSVYPFMFYRGRRCPKCNYSRGEKLVEAVLNSLDINFEAQKKFKGLKNINNLSYDFYLTEYNVLIEYQGQQHYKPVDLFGGEEYFLKQQKNDRIKKEFSKNNNFYLLEIPYTKYTFDSVKEEIELMLSNVKQGTTNQKK